MNLSIIFLLLKLKWVKLFFVVVKLKQKKRDFFNIFFEGGESRVHRLNVLNGATKILSKMTQFHIKHSSISIVSHRLFLFFFMENFTHSCHGLLFTYYQCRPHILLAILVVWQFHRRVVQIRRHLPHGVHGGA